MKKRMNRLSANSRRQEPGSAFSRIASWFGMKNTVTVVSRMIAAEQGNSSPMLEPPDSVFIASRRYGNPKQVTKNPTEPNARTHSKCELFERYNRPRPSAIPCGIRLV